jgi:hypothetical protein
LKANALNLEIHLMGERSWDSNDGTGIRSGYLLEGSVKIGDQVIDMLNPYRDPDQGISQPDLFS